MGFKLKSKRRTSLEYDTGEIMLHVNRSTQARPPTPSFGVKNIEKAKRLLKGARCLILIDRGSSFYFRDPFGNIFDVTEN